MSVAIVLVTSVGEAEGAKAAAAALACAGAEPDRAALLVELSDGRAPRPTLVASAAARGLEERLATHLPEADVASRGRLCHLTLAAGPTGLERLVAAAAVGRDAALCAVLVPSRLLRPALAQAGFDPTAALLRADLAAERALSALVARDLIDFGLRVAILKRPLGRPAACAALLGALPPGSSAGLPSRLVNRLSHPCYIEKHGTRPDTTRAAQQQRRDHAGAGSR